ncbi:hypothetical protein [Pseudomonas syringae]|uniref:hypothetical protein n=1 Tax=Pseudomonas syringae TaxID=317 RepID=UPI0013C302CE|nr:hypothetical protein [Pseudomonas syringae]MCH5508803.1 hypothetical protein [Pseudomonas syringae pv. syringae]MCH5637694.1 hypothetical protein [Pseudomonas syringae pv. syringae]MCH7426827.1 hypothetical protein [Pseudomonas syringae pv. syringae]
MKMKCVMLLMIALISGCANYSPGKFGGKENPRNISCNATPPNQPGCYEAPTKYGQFN